jgi:aminopeptidase N
VANPGDPSFLFNGTVYDRGAMTLEALREKIGNDAVFFEIMRRQAQANRFGTVSTPEFVTLAEQVSGLDLDKFFQAWLFAPGKPTDW